ncbi:MAG: HEAT repeat domain-containing protein, partial [Planctomycetota bacterium]|nr:HEAT repeat domain-containing protein [Planctomycetota bacterium]
RLHDPDREMRTEAARTLGVIGDRRAAPSLLEILRESHDDRVVTASCEALARLGEIAAIYEMLPRLRAARNPVLRRSLAVAVADLLGQRRGEFYRILSQEEEEYGSEAADLINHLCRRIGRATSDALTAPGETLVAKAKALRAAYDDRQYRRCADLMFELAIGLAAFKHGVRFGGNAEVLVEDLIFRDEKFAVGVWYLNLLRENPQPAAAAPSRTDMVEVLLGIYFLSSHAPEER